MNEVAWRPDPAKARKSNVGRFMAEHAIDSFAELQDRSVQDPSWFWGEVATSLGIPFSTPWTEVLDTSDGIPWAKWFVGGRTNLASACVDRWCEETPDAEAVRWEGEDGEVRILTYEQLQSHVDALAHFLRRRNIGPGDAVGIFLPMLPETVIAAMGVAELGATFLPLFSGYGADAIAVRLNDAEAKALITADGFLRRGSVVPMEDTARAAAAEVPTMDTMIVVPRLGRLPGRRSILIDDENPYAVFLWPDLDAQTFATEQVDSEHPLFIAYTSGTTGKPKGVGARPRRLHREDRRRGGVPVRLSTGRSPVLARRLRLDHGAVGDRRRARPTVRPSAVRRCAGPSRCRTDCGPTSNGTASRSSASARRSSARSWPTATPPVTKHDLSRLRILGSTGEPWNEGPVAVVLRRGRWRSLPGDQHLGRHRGRRLLPVAASGAGAHPDDARRSGARHGGRRVRRRRPPGARPRSVSSCAPKPWPGMTRGLWKDPERYLETYWSRWPDVWVHGDWAIDRGRPVVSCTAAATTRSRSPASASGRRRSSPRWCRIPRWSRRPRSGCPTSSRARRCGLRRAGPGGEPSDELRAELSDRRRRTPGQGVPAERASASPTALPKTRSAKVLRRAIRAAAVGADPGDLSSLEDPAAARGGPRVQR